MAERGSDGFKDKVWQEQEHTSNPIGFDNPVLKKDEIMSKNIIDVIRGIIIINITHQSTFCQTWPRTVP